MASEESLRRGLDCLARREWSDVDLHLTEAWASGELEPSVLEQLAVARFLIGHQEASEGAWAAAHESFLRAGDRRGAARCAFWLGLLLVLRGEMARGGGWLGRAGEALPDGEECAEVGLLMIPQGLHAMNAGEADLAASTFLSARELGGRVGAPDVVALGQLGLGQTLLRRSRPSEGLVALDRLMADIEAETRISPVVKGIAYCAVIEECQRAFDVGRAREWTTALGRWLGSEPDVVAYRGHCLVYRAEVVQRHGDWRAAVVEARRARDSLSAPPGHPATGLALYRLGELHRLRGEFAEAETAYVEANRWGRPPQPGLALLRLAQGDVDSASHTIRRLLGDEGEATSRCEVLSAAVRILLAAGDVNGARIASGRLADMAAELASPFLLSLAAYGEGCVAVADGRPADAVDVLASSLGGWLVLQAPYEEGLTRAALGAAYRALEDEDSARLELATARRLFEELGAGPDAALLDDEPEGSPAARSGLSLRELQVLRLVATGATNRAIADALYISVRTVDRHVSNLYLKLGVSTRTAATAYAYDHRLT